jgi:galactosylceramidase
MLQRRKKGSLSIVIMLLLSLLAPMLTPPIPAQADTVTILFSDDFQDGTISDWKQDGGTWSVINEAGSDTNKVLRQSHTSNEAILTNGDLGWSDYSYEAQIGFVDGGAYPGLLVRAQDNRNFYMLRINPAVKKLEFSKRVGGTDSATLASSSMPELTVNTTYTLKIEALGSYFRCYLNGNLAFEYYDADQSFPTGKIGFRDRWGAFQADNIVVSTLAAKKTPYKDDFESGVLTGWTAMTGDGRTVVDAASAGWSVVESVYGGTKLLQRSAPEEGLLVGGVQSQFNNRITAQYSTQEEAAAFGIVGRLNSSGDHYMLKANTTASSLELVKRISGTSTVISSVYYDFVLNTPYSLSLDLLDNELTGFVNGEQLLQAVDGALEMGKAGLWTAGGTIRIDEVSSSVLSGSKLDTISVSLNDSAVGRMYEGISYVSSSGSTKLLMDYPPEQQQDIIDLLFKPNFGASLDHYKMEIGSDANSSSGTEPSHMRSATDFDITRGSGLWLAKRAKEVNPELTLEALRWGTPKWITNNDEKYLFYKNYLQGARDVFGLEIDYLGPDQNEGAFDRNYVVNTLRPGLDRDGFENVKLIARDAVSNPWDIATQMKSDPALRDAIDVIGGHYIFTSTADAQASGKPLWHSEARPPMRSQGLRGSAGALSDVVKGIMTSYVNGKMTRFEMQPFLESWYDIVPYNTKGALVADKPWSGYYFADKGVWLTAHFTQFAKPGWYYLDSASAVGDKFNYVTYKKPDNSGHYSVVVVNTTDKPQKYMFTVSGGLSKGIVHPWKTTETEDFVKLPDIVPEDGAYSITLEPYSVYSLTTTTGQQKGQPKHPIPADTHLALPYADSFDGYAVNKQPLYAHDQGGAFEVTDAGLSGKGLRQVITADIKPGDWRGTPDPYTLLGDLEWANYSVSTDVTLEGNASGYAYLAGRVVDSPYSNAPAVGYNLKLNGNGAWELRLGGSVLKNGTVSGFDASKWHKLKLSFVSDKLSAFIDGSKVTDYTIPIGGLSSGQIALGSGYHFATFDNLKVEVADPAVPAYVERIDNAEPGIVYAGGAGRWSHVIDSYSHFRRTLSKASAGSLVSVNDRTTGTDLYQFNYTGSWSSGSQSGAHNGDNSWSSVAGNAFSVKFVGTQAHIYSAQAAGHGIFAVSIDGGAETLIDLYSPTRTDQKLVYSSPVLPHGEHTIQVRVTGTRNSSATGAAVVADRIDVDTGESKDAELQYTFTGTGFNLIGIADGGRIKADIYVDGALKESVDQPAEMNGYKRVLYRLTGLTDGTHSLKVVLKSNVQLDALEIYGAGASSGMATALIGPARVNAGDEFELSYTISGVSGDVFAQKAAFIYDPSKLEFISAESPKYGFATVDTSIAGKARFLAASTGQAIDANGELLKLRWKVKQTAATGTATITVTDVELGLADGAELSVEGSAYQVEIAYVDKSALNARIVEAQIAHDSAVEGTAVGQYPAGSKAKLLAAIEAAKVVAADAAVSSEQVEQALAMLTSELAAFKASVVTRMYGDLNGDGRISIGDLGIAAQYYGKTSSDPNWEIYRIADLNQDGKVDIIDISAVAQKILNG